MKMLVRWLGFIFLLYLTGCGVRDGSSSSLFEVDRGIDLSLQDEPMMSLTGTHLISHSPLPLEIEERLSEEELALLTHLPHLNVGESSVVKVEAVNIWNYALQVFAGEEYVFSTPEDAIWTDYYIATGPDGYSSFMAPFLSQAFLRAAEKNRRLPKENWFKLSGCSIELDKKSCFAIGASSTHVISINGILALFANDLLRMYHNNSGEIQVTIYRQR